MSVQELASQLMTVSEAAARMGRNRETVRDAIERGRIPSARIGLAGEKGAIVVMHARDVQTYAERNGIKLKTLA